MFSFTATIYKTGINPCVDVPLQITGKMTTAKGYIPVKGKMRTHAFVQTLVPVKESPYRLYVNGLMLKGANVKVGDTLKFFLEYDEVPRTSKQITIHPELKKQLEKYKLFSKFNSLTDYRQKEILKYLNYLKTREAVVRNVEKLIMQLKGSK